ncbi:MAG: DUF924 family protein [Desulfocapsaceae bacterium]
MYRDIIKFWFEEIEPSQWWTKDDEFDQLIKLRYSDLHEKAVRCELFEWRTYPQGRLAEIIILDQFSRNMFRGTPEAFAQDRMALILSQEAISLGIDKLLKPQERGFVYLPLMHSESIAIHEKAEEIYRQFGNQSSLGFELKHKMIIEKFGRYPHRNEILGRESTEEEREFLKQPGSSF